MALYMKYGDIKGAVTTDGFKDWIELNSFQWGASRNIGTAARGATTREHSEPNLSEASSPHLGTALIRVVIAEPERESASGYSGVGASCRSPGSHRAVFADHAAF